ncbi:MAG: methyltransferase domain-containing protein [Actinobacteria bacterium]|nr:methyltransferase domain-containing protein [Actinomycetota bacterium]
MKKHKTQILVCPVCRGGLEPDGAGLSCRNCGLSFEPNGQGYLEFALDRSCFETASTTDEHAEMQSSPGAVRMDEEFIIPYLLGEPEGRYLDAGCGIGRTVSRLLEQGQDAYGIDLPCLSEYWRRFGNDPERFFCCDAGHLPFPDGFFDAVISLGVIEHVGTINGEATLADDYREARRAYAAELLRVTRPGGRILVACPNKRFPVDPQHIVKDEYSGDGIGTRLRAAIGDRTGLNIHPVWGRYHLLSYAEVRQHFCDEGGARSFEPLPVKGYFGLTIFKKGILRPLAPLADLYINRMPAFIRKSFLNPYMLAEIRK